MVTCCGWPSIAGRDSPSRLTPRTPDGAGASSSDALRYNRCPTSSRKWRNWQTRKPQELVGETSWGFKSPLPHQPSEQRRSRYASSRSILHRPLLERSRHDSSVDSRTKGKTSMPRRLGVSQRIGGGALRFRLDRQSLSTSAVVLTSPIARGCTTSASRIELRGAGRRRSQSTGRPRPQVRFTPGSILTESACFLSRRRSSVAFRRGVALALVVIGAPLVLAAMAVTGVFVFWSREPVVPEQTTLVLRLGGELPEVVPDDVLGQVIRTARPVTLQSQIETIRKAKVDRRIVALVVRPAALDVSLWAKLQELHQALVDFRRSGKQAVAFLEYAGEREYYLATACDRVFMTPSAVLERQWSCQLRAVLARHPRQGRRLSRSLSNRRPQDGPERPDAEVVHAGAPRDDGVAESRPVRTARASHGRWA